MLWLNRQSCVAEPVQSCCSKEGESESKRNEYLPFWQQLGNCGDFSVLPAFLSAIQCKARQCWHCNHISPVFKYWDLSKWNSITLLRADRRSQPIYSSLSCSVSTCLVCSMLSECKILLAFYIFLIPCRCTWLSTSSISLPFLTGWVCAWPTSAALCCWECLSTVLRSSRFRSAFPDLEWILCSSVWLLRRSLAHSLTHGARRSLLWEACIKHWVSLLSLNASMFRLSPNSQPSWQRNMWWTD